MKDVFYKIFIFLSLVAIFGMMGLLLLSSYWAWYPYDISDYIVWSTEKNLILNKDHIIRGGETIKWQVDLEVKQSFVAETTRFIQSNDLGCDFKILPTTTMVVDTGLRQYTNVSYIVPVDFKPCTYYVHLVSTIQVNPNRKIEFTRDTEFFQVP